MEFTDALKQKATDLFKTGMPLSQVYYAMEQQVTYGDLWALKRELPETGPASKATRRFKKGGGGGHGGGGGTGGGGGGGGGKH